MKVSFSASVSATVRVPIATMDGNTENSDIKGASSRCQKQSPRSPGADLSIWAADSVYAKGSESLYTREKSGKPASAPLE